MALEQSWTVGAAAECDIVVDHPTVSGRHCRLTRTADGFLLEDLDSTNGTFVNGTRITAPLAVSSADEIKLGPESHLPWETIDPQPTDRQIIRIGRTADNEVVLDYPNISGNHARIIIENGKATIEDLGSTNGIAIGNPQNLVQSAALSDSDTVYFGSMAIPAASLLHPGREPISMAMAAGHESIVGKVLQSPRSIALAVASLVVLVVLVCAVTMSLKPSGTSTDNSTPTTVAIDDATDPEPPPPATEIAKNPIDAIYSVLVQNNGIDQLLHVGTAWAVSEHQLVTSGVVTRYLEKYSEDIAVVQVRCASQDKVFVATRWDVHPEFKRAEIAIKVPVETAQEKRQKLQELQAAAKPTGQAELDALKKELDTLVEQLIDAEETLYLAGETMVYFDVGLLTVDETLPFVLEIRQPSRTLAVQTKTALYGVPYDREAMVSLGPQEPSKLEGRLLRVVRQSDTASSPLRRLLVSAPVDHHSGEWRGSPVLDDEGHVVGVYVRPTPPVDPEKPVTGKSFDALLVEQLRRLPVDLPEGHN